MVSFNDHYNTISIDTLPSKTKIGKDSWYFNNNSLLSKPKFSSVTKTFIFLLKTKNSHSSESDWWEYTKYCFKENAKMFPKNSTTQENIRILRLREDCKNLYKKENFKPEIKPMI